MAIKSITKGPWGDGTRTATTWYEPFDQMDEIQPAVNFVLSYEVSGLCTVGDVRILPMVVKACENYSRPGEGDRERMIERGTHFEALFI